MSILSPQKYPRHKGRHRWTPAGVGSKKLPWEQRTVNTLISIPRGIRAKLDTMTEDRGISRAKVILEAIENYLGVSTKDLPA